ncbi:uncharacterized protein LOC115634750 [Scaptodrosophila lebanonensis]|uniref:Uncharacterized protein LOC115634750 n=1 Tax=Drosophila lebanonensis TaxID=7225 RepID=A0A6J2UJX8_DROLE|nr:uncharacterized protein LOC115634750 [Scaptodrosophila lebanonensis]
MKSLLLLVYILTFNNVTSDNVTESRDDSPSYGVLTQSLNTSDPGEYENYDESLEPKLELKLRRAAKTTRKQKHKPKIHTAYIRFEVPKVVEPWNEDGESATDIVKPRGPTSNIKWGYSVDPKRPLNKECQQSTRYFPDHPWVLIKQRNELIKKPRPYLKDLRTSMYKKQDPDECHTPQMTNVREFLECQIIRHMRIAMIIPKYPAVPAK